MKRQVPSAWLFQEVLTRFVAFAVAPTRDESCARRGAFRSQLKSLIVDRPLGRTLRRCVSGGGCFGRARSAPPCGGPGEFHYPWPAARERAEAQRRVMAAAAAFLAAAEKIMALHADAPKETFAAALAEFEQFMTPALHEKAVAIRNQFGV